MAVRLGYGFIFSGITISIQHKNIYLVETKERSFVPSLLKVADR